MRKTFLTSLLILLALTSCGPVIAPGNVHTGGAFLIDVEEGVYQVENNTKGYDKYGKACVKNFLYLVSVGDASIAQAKKDGHMQRVHRIEREKNGFGFVFILPFIYTKSCTVVYGE